MPSTDNTVLILAICPQGVLRFIYNLICGIFAVVFNAVFVSEHV